ncbi:hypothetical protein Nepgr_001786 [Nepenthes gracilis]|uniref:Uncharacterized protein n=1 Tax=Nepenthes gracilis TaxID=150966 RepID=A0AAD3P942_NEPGR|nr:hypothetical protein Nepgr_001786 [Nepenthes gracilis]
MFVLLGTQLSLPLPPSIAFPLLGGGSHIFLSLGSMLATESLITTGQEAGKISPSAIVNSRAPKVEFTVGPNSDSSGKEMPTSSRADKDEKVLKVMVGSSVLLAQGVPNYFFASSLK